MRRPDLTANLYDGPKASPVVFPLAIIHLAGGAIETRLNGRRLTPKTYQQARDFGRRLADLATYEPS